MGFSDASGRQMNNWRSWRWFRRRRQSQLNRAGTGKPRQHGSGGD